MAFVSLSGAWKRLFVAAGACALSVGGAGAQTTTTYTYDALGRVTAAVNSPSGKKVIYAYDAAGNRTQVGNGVAYAEVLPVGFSASTANAATTGLTTSGMRDQVFNARSSIYATPSETESGAWVRANLNPNANIDHIDIAPADDAGLGVGPWNLNGARIDYWNGSAWVTSGIVSGVVSGGYLRIPMGGVLAGHVRIMRTTPGQIAIGDFRLYSSDDTSNEAPVAANDSAWTNSGAAVTISVLANDTDPENKPLSISAYTQPANGVVTQSGTNLIYTANSGFVGSNTFTYTASDGSGGTAIGSVNVTVQASSNTPPVAVNDAVSSPAYRILTLDPRLNDTDANGDGITITSVGAASHGVAIINAGGSVTYKPSSGGYTGPDNFTYTISDGRGGTSSATVSVTLTTGSPSMLSVMVPATYASQVSLSGASFNVPSNSYVNVYVDRPMTSGKYYWEVKAQCAALGTGVTANVSTAQNLGGYYTANAGTYTGGPGQRWTSNSRTSGIWSGDSTPSDVFGFAFDADARTLKVYRNNIAGGTLTLPFFGPFYAHTGVQPGVAMVGQACLAGEVRGEFIFGAGATAYTPPFGYAPLDQQSANSPPLAVNDNRAMRPNTTLLFDPRENDSDPEGFPLTVTGVSTPTNGTVVINGGTTVSYTPSAGYTGSASFNYTLSDGRGGTATASVAVTISSTATVRSFTISPSFAGKSTWNIDTDGPLDLSTVGTWTIVPTGTFTATTKAWGGGGGGALSSGQFAGGGGFATGLVSFQSGVSYTLYVAGGGQAGIDASASSSNPAGGSPGGGRGQVVFYSDSNGNPVGYYAGAGGGGYSGIRKTAGTPILLAGGGGGQAVNGAAGGPGGGSTGGSSDTTGGAAVSTGGSQTAGGVGGGGLGTTGAQYQGGIGAQLFDASFASGGGGGGGYYGGGGGSGNSSGGGGAGYADTTDVSGSSLTAGTRGNPGATSDPDRGTAGVGGGLRAAGGAGRLKLR